MRGNLLKGIWSILRCNPIAFGLRQSIKLTSKYYGPFWVIEKVGNLAYKIHLLEEVKIHPVFHASQLKKHKGSHAVPQTNLPLVGEDGKIKTEPVVVMETRSLPRNVVLVTQWLVEWANLAPDEASWEDANIMKIFHAFYSKTLKSWFPNGNTWGQVFCHREWIVRYWRFSCSYHFIQLFGVYRFSCVMMIGRCSVDLRLLGCVG